MPRPGLTPPFLSFFFTAPSPSSPPFFSPYPSALPPFVAQENYTNYDKGVLAEILEPIMGKVGGAA